MPRDHFHFLAHLASLVIIATTFIISRSYLSSQTQTTLPQPSRAAANLPAFPGAEGFGSTTPGGRGGKVIAVTNLNQSGPGSLREALEANGPRIVVFKTGGYITINTPIVIKNPFLTIAAQTAPGDGIVIRNSPLIIATHDVIVRGLRVRVGDDPTGYSSGSRDGINISSTFSNQDIYNVIVDHSSVSWALDENLSTWTNKVHDVTIQWSISSEALDDSIHVDEGQPAGVYDPHSMGILIGSEGARRISLHHNLLAHNHDRIPYLKGTTEFINNTVYNWGGGAYPGNFTSTGLTLSNFINNYYLRGTNSTSTSRMGVYLESTLGTGSRIYMNGNLFYNQDNTLLGQDLALGNLAFRSASLISNTSLPAPSFAIQSTPDAYSAVLASAGAISPKRDSVDDYTINSVKNRTGTLIDCVITCNEASDRRNFHGGWPSYAPGTPPVDADSDGIPNNWEISHGLNPQTNDSAADSNSDGYTNIEEYINSLLSVSQSSTPTPTSQTPASSAPIGWWKMDENTGTSTTADSSGNGNTAIMSNFISTDWSAGRTGGALNFDATNNLINTGSNPVLDNLPALSVSAWINPRSAGENSFGRILDKEGGWFWAVNSALNLEFRAAFINGTATQLRRVTSSTVPLNSWTHVALTWTGSSSASDVKIYINGIETSYSVSQNGSLDRQDDSSGNLYLGNNAANASHTWDGLLDNIRLYGRAITQSEVEGLYSFPPVSTPAPGNITHVQTVTGGSSSNNSVTSTPITAQVGDLYLASVVTRWYTPISVSSISGLGLTWTKIGTQCSARNSEWIEVWKANGTPTVSGPVTAALSAAPVNAVITVSRYSGTHPTSPTGTVATANTRGPSGTCPGSGTDTNSYSINIPLGAGSVAYAATALRHASNTPGSGTTERAEVHQGNSGNVAGLVVGDTTTSSASGLTSSAVDWATIAVEIKP